MKMIKRNSDVAVTICLGGACLNHVGVEIALFLHFEVLLPRNSMATVIGGSKETNLLFFRERLQKRMAKIHQSDKDGKIAALAFEGT